MLLEDGSTLFEANASLSIVYMYFEIEIAIEVGIILHWIIKETVGSSRQQSLLLLLSL